MNNVTAKAPISRGMNIFFINFFGFNWLLVQVFELQSSNYYLGTCGKRLPDSYGLQFTIYDWP